VELGCGGGASGAVKAMDVVGEVFVDRGDGSWDIVDNFGLKGKTISSNLIWQKT